MNKNQQKRISLKSRNIAYGSFDISFTGREGNVTTITDEFVSVSGYQNSKLMIDNNVSESIEGRTIIPDVPEENHRRVQHTIDSQSDDSERKLIEEILRQMEEKSGIRLNYEGNYQGLGFSGTVELYSEQSPCDSCEDIIENQFKNMFGGDLDINVKHGVEYDLPEDMN
ncbi:deaminase domain-containing protein [Baaleninema simplex]|uniref:deaminase domain-containing protein n=1 Tax=Baaleninema simplex TaxID=2862350 RepID=UPI00037B6931|nr:deaminase domain-containing protein [Baaleninema simplex]